MEQKNLTLKEALSKGNLKQFIKERITQTGGGDGNGYG